MPNERRKLASRQVLDAARQAAESATLDRSAIYPAFVALLDAPPQPSERLRKSLKKLPAESRWNRVRLKVGGAAESV